LSERLTLPIAVPRPSGCTPSLSVVRFAVTVSGGGLRREMASAAWSGPESSETGSDAGRLSKCGASFVQWIRVASHAELLRRSKLRGPPSRRLLMRVVSIAGGDLYSAGRGSFALHPHPHLPPTLRFTP
jgi:hypothetical protein